VLKESLAEKEAFERFKKSIKETSNIIANVDAKSQNEQSDSQLSSNYLSPDEEAKVAAQIQGTPISILIQSTKKNKFTCWN